MTLRMLLNAQELQSYLQCAFNHFAESLDVPFDFIQAAFLNNPIPSTFSGSVLKLAVTIMRSEKKPQARAIFTKLSQLIASCILLDSVRHNILGMQITASTRTNRQADREQGPQIIYSPSISIF
jgi:hypothetical protein